MMTVVNNSIEAGLLNMLERELLHMIVYEYCSGEISQELGVSLEEVDRLKNLITDKLGVDSIVGAIRVAYESRILQISANQI